MQFHYAAVLSVALGIVTPDPEDVAEMKSRFLQAARQATRPTAVHPKYTDDVAHLSSVKSTSEFGLFITALRERYGELARAKTRPPG